MDNDQSDSGFETSGNRILITGGTGFVGSAIRQALGGHQLRLILRTVTGQLQAEPGIEVIEGDVANRESLRGAAKGCSTVIHLVAIIEEQGNATFDRIIRQGTENVIAEAREAGTKRFIQMSALGARDDSRFPYMQAKWRAEQALINSKIPYTIFRPSVIFGPDDGFINALAGVVRQFPVVPVVGTGTSKFQPVSVSEVAEAIAHSLGDNSTLGQILELGGGQVYTYEQLLDVIAVELGKRRPKVHIPVGLMMPIVKMCKPLPAALRPPVTIEQLKMLNLDNVTEVSAMERLLGRPPMSLQDGIGYIKR